MSKEEILNKENIQALADEARSKDNGLKLDIDNVELNSEIYDRSKQGIKVKIGLDLSNLDLRGSNFTNTNLEGANLTNTNLAEVNFAGSNLKDVKFGPANIPYADFRNTTNLTPIQFVDAKGVETALFNNKEKMLADIAKLREEKEQNKSNNNALNKFLKFISNLLGDAQDVFKPKELVKPNIIKESKVSINALSRNKSEKREKAIFAHTASHAERIKENRKTQSEQQTQI